MADLTEAFNDPTEIKGINHDGLVQCECGNRTHFAHAMNMSQSTCLTCGRTYQYPKRVPPHLAQTDRIWARLGELRSPL
jgi:hypothetical protein